MKIYSRSLFLSAILMVFALPVIAQGFDGYALYNEMNNNTAYLVDKDNNIAHSWSCNVSCNYTVLLKDNGNIVRGGTYANNQITGAAVGGMVQEYGPAGNVVWEFIYSDNTHVSHHDITLLPNGNVILTAWEVKSQSELQAAGYTGTASQKYPTHFIEVAQDGTGGQIVWEWHIWDHMVQDADPNKPNYGVVADHPELMNINVPVQAGGGPGGGSGDWFHVNGVDYYPDLDQIVFSSRFLSEVMVIDHSTTTAEAAGHTGGNSGMGGDILYRWGKPSNYDTPGTQTIAGAVHDARFITNDGRPNAGFIQFFNNVGGTGGSSAVDAISAPHDGYTYSRTPGQAYGPSTYTWRHDCIDNASGQSASNRMPNGNTFVTLSRKYMYEVDSLDNLVWQHNAQPSKGFRYTCDDPGIIALLGNDPCGLVGISEAEIHQIKVSPNPSKDVFNFSGIALDEYDSEIVVRDLYGKEVKRIANSSTLDMQNQANGIYFASIIFENGQSITQKITLLK